MRAFIENECRLPRNQWIYKIIESDLEDTDERVFLDRPEWCLCLDKHRSPPAAASGASGPCPPARAAASGASGPCPPARAAASGASGPCTRPARR
jgi:hypothetical protein